PVSDWIMNIISINSFRVLDIYPLPLLMASAISSLAIVYAVQKSVLEKNAVSIVIFSFVFISPYLLQNIIYKYDSLAMALGTS
ncbi:hypothetical protein OSK00_26385, partial [Escherichia coli]|nr:hypothetical protein [Escherichia coli]